MKTHHSGLLILLALTTALSTLAVHADDTVGSPADYDAILKKYVKGDYFQYGELKKNKKDQQTRVMCFHGWSLCVGEGR